MKRGPEDWAKWYKMRLQGVPEKEIADAYGVQRGVISNGLWKYRKLINQSNADAGTHSPLAPVPVPLTGEPVE